jgi:hypothetical protein
MWYELEKYTIPKVGFEVRVGVYQTRPSRVSQGEDIAAEMGAVCLGIVR